MIPARVITVSDRCHAGTAEDLSGPLVAHILDQLAGGDHPRA